MKKIAFTFAIVFLVASWAWAEEPWMSPGMMHQDMDDWQPLWMQYYRYPECTQFLDSTVDMRRRLLNKQFDYFEATRKPDTNPALINQLEIEINKLMFELDSRAPMRCRTGSRFP